MLPANLTAPPRSPAVPHLTDAERDRYRRHLLLNDVGEAGQLALKNARVLLIGAGGLGAPIGLYLAAAGVGHIGLIDDDTVDTSNLQRQVLYGTQDVGQLKVHAAAARLRDLNPHITIQPYPTRFTAENAFEIAEGYDLIIDGCDNFTARYLANDLAVITQRPLVHAAIYQFDGQATVFAHNDGPCYRCLYPEPPPAALAPNCAEAGVLGVLPGLVGLIQATEALKIILGRGETLSGRLMMIDALSMKFREMRISRNPNCPVCGDTPTIRTLADVAAACAATQVQCEWDLSPAIYATRHTEATLIDVREPHEITPSDPGGQLIPLSQLDAAQATLDPTAFTIIYCAVGARSARAVTQLRAAGFTDVWNLRGGVRALRK
jgi:adenylyltransferase/sulfurtransferase